jgi:hypothetical protein
MNDSEQRRAARKRALDQIDVTDALTGENLGRVGNLSREGMMLIGSRQLNDDALYQVRFQLRDNTGKPHALEAGVHEQWSEPAAISGQYWAGLRMIALSDADDATLAEWLDEPED